MFLILKGIPLAKFYEIQISEINTLLLPISCSKY
jgi:hypothetical protein